MCVYNWTSTYICKLVSRSRGLFQELKHLSVGKGANPIPGLLHFTLDPYFIMLSVKQVPFFESLVWLDLGLKTGLLNHRRTRYSLFQLAYSEVCSPMVLKTRVQSQVESFQRLKKKKKWHLIPLCLTLSIIKGTYQGYSGTIQEKECRPALHLSVVAIEEGTFCPPSNTGANFTTINNCA